MSDSITILLLATDPRNLLALHHDSRLIVSALQFPHLENKIKIRATWLISPNDLQRELHEFRPAIIHFSGHGSQSDGFRYLTDDGIAGPVDSDDLIRVLRVAREVSAIVLHGCDVQAEAFTQVAPCVLDVPGKHERRDADTYASSFYAAVALGHSMGDAHRRGLSKLVGTYGDVRVPPVLLARSQIDADDIRIVRGPLVITLLESQDLGTSMLDPVFRRATQLSAATFAVSSDPAVRITVYDSLGADVASGDGSLSALLPSGIYRVHFDRFGRVRERLVDHDRITELYDAGPPLVTPVPVNGTMSHDYFTPAAELSIADTCPPLAEAAGSRLFLFVRRRDPNSGPREVPSEPVTIHDVNGLQLTVLSRETSRINREVGYAALSIRVAPGTYRLRTGRSRWDLAITIPPGRAAHVFLADRGLVVLHEARVSLVPVEGHHDPGSRSGRLMEDALEALRTPDRDLAPQLRERSPALFDEDLCLGLAIAHLAWRAGQWDRFERVMERLRGYDMIPDVAILKHVSAPSPGERPSLMLTAPPLFQASLALALTHPELEGHRLVASGAVEQATRARYLDSIWCTWSARSWDERWIEPTVDALRRRDPGVSAVSLARRLQLLPCTVERVVEALDARAPLVDGKPASIREIRVPGYTVDDELGRGSQGIVVEATRERDGQKVALKIVPISGGESQLPGIERDLDRVLLLRHPNLISCPAHGRLSGGAGLWLEMERCRGSVMDLLDEHDAPLDPAEVCRIALDALEGLAVLHDHGFVHRGIRPGNLLLRDDGGAVLGDIGLAGISISTDQLGLECAAASVVRFAAREQLLDVTATTPASDIWSMAATLYFMLTLELPRGEYADQRKLQAALDNPVVPIREHRSGLPESLARCIDRALDPVPGTRPRDAAAFSRELAIVVHHDRVRPPERTREDARTD